MKPVFLLLALLLGWAAPSLPAQESGRYAPPSQQWVGLLGFPFGTRLEIEGGKPVRPTMASGPAFEVRSVNGKALSQPVTMTLRPFQDGAPVTLEPGTAYTLLGYEAGGFGSSPDWVCKMTGTYPQAGFAFRSVFVVVNMVALKVVAAP